MKAIEKFQTLDKRNRQITNSIESSIWTNNREQILQKKKKNDDREQVLMFCLQQRHNIVSLGGESKRKPESKNVR